ncbi:hypothetical protein [Nitrospira sp. Kam-Ns4a]
MSVLAALAVWVLGLAAASPAAPLAAERQPAAERVLDLRAGRSYPAGVRLRSPFLGISFVVPDRWRARLQAGTLVVHLESGSRPGVGVVLLLQDVGPEEVEARLREPQAFEEAFVLHPVGGILSDGKTWLATYAGGETFGTAAALLGPGRQAVIYLFASPGEEAATYGEVLARLTASTRFEDPRAAKTLRDWYQRLSGMQFVRPSTGSGQVPSTGSEPSHAEGPAGSSGATFWHLCHDGTFSIVRRSGQPAGETVEEGSGDWRIEASAGQVRLVLSFSTGATRTLSLRFEGSAAEVVLDGAPVSHAVSDLCP